METPNTFFPGGEDPIFRRVWERVTAAEAPAEPKRPQTGRPMPPGCSPEVTGRLCAFLERELRSWRTLRALSKAGVRETAGLSDRELRHAKQLSSRLFLHCGIRYFPKDRIRPIPFSSVPEGLRACYRDAVKRSEAYDRAISDERDPELRKLYGELAKDDRALAQRLRRITGRYLSVRPGRHMG